MEDTICLLYIYLPLLQAQLHQFVERWNDHKIRKQTNRPSLPTGEPYYNYYFPPDGIPDYGSQPSRTTIAQIRDQKLRNMDTGQLYGK